MTARTAARRASERFGYDATMVQASGFARVAGLAVIAAAAITCVPPASVPAGGGGGPAPVTVDAGGPDEALDAGAGAQVDAVVAGAIDRSPPPRTLAPERPTAAPPPMRYPLEVASARTAADLQRDAGFFEELVPTVRVGDPERPMLLWRQAAVYRELAFAAAADPSAAAAVAAAERAQIATLAKLRSESPTWCASPNPTPALATGCGDEQAYLAARGFQRLGEVTEARKLYLAVLQKWPTSRLAPVAYAAIGDMFLAAAAADPAQLTLARQSLSKATELAPPTDPMYVQVRHRLAHVAWLEGDLATALRELQQTIEVSLRYASAPGAAALAERARADLLPVYVATGSAKRAHDFVRPLSGDAGGGTALTIAWLDRLWAAYVAAGAYADGVDLIDDLAVRDSDGPRWCARAAERLEVIAWGLGASERLDQEVAGLLSLLDQLARRASDPAVLAACRPRAAEVVVTVLLARDLDVIGSAAAPGPRAPAGVQAIVAGYRAALAAFTDDDLAAARFPRLPAGVRPTRASLEARVEALLPLAR